MLRTLPAGDARTGDGSLPDATVTEAGLADSGASLPGWTLVWSDEFDGADDGSAADPTKWTHDPDGTTTCPQTLRVDWVRVYEKSGTEP